MNCDATAACFFKRVKKARVNFDMKTVPFTSLLNKAQILSQNQSEKRKHVSWPMQRSQRETVEFLMGLRCKLCIILSDFQVEFRIFNPQQLLRT